MAVYVSNMVIEQGFDFETTFQLEDTRTNSFLDLNGSTPTSQMRKHPGSSTSVSFASSITNADRGQITLYMSATETQSLKPGRYVFDIKLSTAGKFYKAVEGSVLVRAGVTR